MQSERILRSVVVVVALACAVAACDRRPTDDDDAPPQPTATAAASAEAAAAAELAAVVASETMMAEPGMQPAGAAFDPRAFAGSFSGTLPCADCPGINERLVLEADGSFTLSDTYRERPGSAFETRGSWSLEPGGQRLRLDPGSKDAQDRLFSIEDDDTLVPLGADGEPTGMPGDPRLRRDR